MVDAYQAAHNRAEDRMNRFDRLPPDWRALARRVQRTRLEYFYAQKVTLACALKRVRLDALMLTDL